MATLEQNIVSDAQ